MWKVIQTAFDGGVPNKKYKRAGVNYIIEMTLIEREGKTTKFKSNEARKVVDKRFAKYRANFLFVDRIYDIAKQKFILHLEHVWIPQDNTLPNVYVDYIANNFVFANGWTEDDDVICGKGIHYFNTLAAAFLYKELLVDYGIKIDFEMNDMSFSQDGALRTIGGFSVTTLKNIKLLEQKYNVSDLIPSCFLDIAKPTI